jgi:para-nitrobenzyl esterase
LIAAWHGRRSRTWEYQFSHGYEPLGAVHLWDQQYVFGIMIPPADQPADRALSEAIEHYWTNFAKTGDPNGGGLPAWPEVGAQGAYLDFTTAGPIHATGLRQQACALFHRRIDSELDALTKELRR